MNDLVKRKWDRGTDMRPGSYTPEQVLEVALAKLREGTIKPHHVIITFGLSDEDFHAHMMQGGSYSSYAQVGLLTATAKLLLDDD